MSIKKGGDADKQVIQSEQQRIHKHKHRHQQHDLNMLHTLFRTHNYINNVKKTTTNKLNNHKH